MQIYPSGLAAVGATTILSPRFQLPATGAATTELYAIVLHVEICCPPRKIRIGPRVTDTPVAGALAIEKPQSKLSTLGLQNINSKFKICLP